MFNVLTALAMGLVVFAISVGVGSVILSKFSKAVSTCPTGFTYYTYNGTGDICCNTTAVTCTGATNSSTSYGDASTSVVALLGDMGTTGLAGWTAAIIALAVGLLFIGSLMGRGRNY